MKKRPAIQKLFCSRFAGTKRKAEKIASQMRAVGGRNVVITGSRGMWRVRGRVDVIRFCKFCADEAAAEQSN